jgi:glycerol-1-phosphatase
MSLLDYYDALLLDLDGTVWEGGRAIPGAVETIHESGLACMYITNNAARAPQEVAEKLRGIGVDTSEEFVLTSSQAAVTLARQDFPAGTKVLILGTESFRNLARTAGFEVVDSAEDNPEVVMQGHNPETGWAQLTEATLAIAGGAAYIATNLDTTLPLERGLAVGNGSMVAAVISATGVAPAAAGKPQPVMFHQAVHKLGATKPLAVGDRLNTDIEGANAANIPTFHVLTGVSGPLALLEAPKEQRPTYLAENMADLKKNAHQLLPGAQGGFTARINRRDILLERGHAGATPIEALRTVLEVAWAMPEPPELIRPGSAEAEAATDGWWR